MQEERWRLRTDMFLRATASSPKRVLAIVILSVHPSVRLSVCYYPVPIQAQVR